MYNTAMDMLDHPFINVGKKHVDQDRQDEFQQFFTSLYMTDVANFLLVLHSATNWLLFMRTSSRPRRKRSMNRGSGSVGSTAYGVTFSSSDNQKDVFLTPSDASLLLNKLQAQSARDFSLPLLSALSASSESVAEYFLGDEPFAERPVVRRLSYAVYHFMGEWSFLFFFVIIECRRGSFQNSYSCISPTHATVSQTYETSVGNWAPSTVVRVSSSMSGD
jgi:hypothetical protein